MPDDLGAYAPANLVTISSGPAADPSAYLAPRHYWIAGGKSWDLSHGTSGLALQGGVRGLGMPPIQRVAQKSPAVAGSRFRSSLADEREVFWPLLIFGDQGSLDYIQRSRDFWSTMNPDVLGTWQVTNVDGQVRYLPCRFSDDGSPAFDQAPALTGRAVYGITLVAEDPFWLGPLIANEYRPGTATNFFGGDAAKGPPFNIGSSFTSAQPVINNPGDVPAWPTYVLFGPLASASFGLLGGQLNFPNAVPNGSWLRLNTDPRDRVLRLGTGTPADGVGVDVTGQLINAQFSPIPAGSAVQFALNLTGAGYGRLEIQPRYYRAGGG